jgi:uncharacterized protein YecE (DUF72 family)
MRWHIGCSGFHYKEWKEVFYPAGLPQRKWFEYYSSRFDTLELNVTFYRFPQLKFLQNWHEVSPAQFSFAVKVPRLISHYKQLNDCERMLDDFYTCIHNGLHEKLGPVLFQFPARFTFTQKRLDLVLNNARPGFTNVMEFRDLGWWNNEVYIALQQKGIIFSGISHPSLPDQAVVNNTVAYYRFHGVPDLYYSAYNPETLQKVADTLLSHPSLSEVFVYFNNTAAVGAIENAVWLKDFLNRDSGI